ncbi:hypothetical protein BJY01DRAFT_256258 [Aspergillus pseudoustus]|uniref:Fungal N-terminal domain-containing protein n=1 Tax=Aspergillus pseudoustus TaxID=1810923 RepID=A0ABR4IE32_9EURO
MSFGWSVGDLIAGATLAWEIYESVGNRERSAKVEFAGFQAEFGLIKSALERLKEVANNCPGEDLALGPGYTEALVRCNSFIERHKALTHQNEKQKENENEPSSSKGKTRRPSIQDRISATWDKVSWPFEREEAQRLRTQLERYVQIAILKVTANTSDRTRKMAVDNLEILQAVKAMSVQVSTILRRCVPDDISDASSLDIKYHARLQRRHLPSMSEPSPGLNAIPEDDELSESQTHAALHRIKDITDRLNQLAPRLDNIGRTTTPSPERRHLQRSHTSDSIGSDTTVGGPIVDLLDDIGDEVRDALYKAGYDHALVPGQHKPSHYLGPTYSSKTLNDAAEDWEQFRDWLQFQVVHSLEVHPDHNAAHENIWHRPSPSPESRYLSVTPPFGMSPPGDSYLRARSPPRSPLRHEEATPMSRTTSNDSSYPGSPLSIASGWDRRSSIQSLPLTQRPVQVLLWDRHGTKRLLHPVTCHVVVHVKQRTSEPEVIESTEVEGGTKLTHCLYREHPSNKAETSMIPYVANPRYTQAISKSPFCIRFMGSHRTQVERPGKEKKKWHISPIYVCQNREDFEMFQSTLLGRRVTFCGDVTRIHSNTGDHCSQESVRVLQDRPTGTNSILYFSTKKDSSRALPHFVDLLASNFSIPKSADKLTVKLSITSAQRDSLGLPRRNSVESTITTLSQKSGNSLFSNASTAASDSGWKKEKYLRFDFESAQDAEKFIIALQAHPE